MKKLCFVVSSPSTASAFLKGPMLKLSEQYEIHLVANASQDENLCKELSIKKFHFINLSNFSLNWGGKRNLIKNTKINITLYYLKLKENIIKKICVFELILKNIIKI